MRTTSSRDYRFTQILVPNQSIGQYSHTFFPTKAVMIIRWLPSRLRFNRLRLNLIPTTRKANGPTPQSRQASQSAVKVIFSGIQPTGVPHLGNYLGALRQWVELQKEPSSRTRLFYCVVDLHAITSFQNPQQLQKWRRETLAALLSVGLDPGRCNIFFQSSVRRSKCALMSWKGIAQSLLGTSTL